MNTVAAQLLLFDPAPAVTAALAPEDPETPAAIQTYAWVRCRQCQGHGAEDGVGHGKPDGLPCLVCKGTGRLRAARFLSLEDQAQLTAGQRRYLVGPIVQYPGGWGLPDWLRDTIVQARLAQVYAELHAGVEALATEEEALAYYTTASAAVPLHADAATIFFWLFCRIVPHFLPHTRQELAEMLAEGTPVPYDLPLHLEHELTDLRRNIRRSVEKHASRD
jgi:hypothetical protein